MILSKRLKCPTHDLFGVNITLTCMPLTRCVMVRLLQQFSQTSCPSLPHYNEKLNIANHKKTQIPTANSLSSQCPTSATLFPKLLIIRVSKKSSANCFPSPSFNVCCRRKQRALKSQSNKTQWRCEHYTSTSHPMHPAVHDLRGVQDRLPTSPELRSWSLGRPHRHFRPGP